MLGIEMLGFWFVVSVAFFGLRRLTVHERRVSHVVPETRRRCA